MYEERQIDFSKLKYVLYARKSTEDQDRQVRSIDDQIADCLDFAERYGLNIVGEPIVETKSAKRSRQRPEFQAMLDGIRKGKYDAILAWHPDRLSRNMLEAGEIIDLLDEEIIKDLKFPAYTFTNDPSGKLLLTIIFGTSKQYSDDLSQKVERGVRRSFAEGKTGTAKWGYKNDEGVFKPDGKNWELLKEAWEMRKDKASLENIVEYLNEKNFHRRIKSTGEKIPVTMQILSRVFKDPFYYGVLVQANQSVDLRTLPGSTFKPVVSEKDWYAIQEMYRDQRIPYRLDKKRKTYYPLRNMVRCYFCGNGMRVGAPQGNIKRYLYYRCDNKQCSRTKRNIRGKVIFNFIYDFLKDGLNFTKAEYEKYYADLEKVSRDRQAKLRGQINTKESKRRRLQHEADTLSLKILNHDENSTVAQAGNRKVTKLQEQIDQLTDELDSLREKLTDPKQERISVEEFLNLSKVAATKLKSADVVAKDRICRLIFLNFSVDDEKVVSYELKEPFKTLLANRDNDSFPTGGDERT